MYFKLTQLRFHIDEKLRLNSILGINIYRDGLRHLI